MAGATPGAAHHPRRHGRVLRVRGAARRPGPARPAGRGRRLARARRGGRGQLRGPAFGVHSAMPSVTARRRCPELVFVRPRFDVYKAVSPQIHAIFARYTPLIQPLSLDEAYLDVTAPLHRPRLRHRHRGGDPRRHPGRNRPDRLGRGVLQQVPGQAGVRPPQARRLVRHHAQDGPGLRGRTCPSAGSTASAPSPRRAWRRSASTPASTCGRSRGRSLPSISARPPTTTTASPAAWTTGRWRPTACGSRSGPRQRSTATSALGRGGPALDRCSPRCGRPAPGAATPAGR